MEICSMKICSVETCSGVGTVRAVFRLGWPGRFLISKVPAPSVPSSVLARCVPVAVANRAVRGVGAPCFAFLAARFAGPLVLRAAVRLRLVLGVVRRWGRWRGLAERHKMWYPGSGGDTRC